MAISVLYVQTLEQPFLYIQTTARPERISCATLIVSIRTSPRAVSKGGGGDAVRVCIERGWFLNAVPGRKPTKFGGDQLLDASRVADVTPSLLYPTLFLCTLIRP